jgi:glycosyltransferase involved in cell wall biosynthesis
MEEISGSRFLPSPSQESLVGRVLLLSYAFPPMQVQMTPAVVKPMAALAKAGFKVDVICADSFCKELPLDPSLTAFCDATFSDIHRLRPESSLYSRLRSSSRIFSRLPDLMGVLHESAYKTLSSMDLAQYDAVMTWSPFHSVNAVMTKLKRTRPKVRWIAQFSDPWAGNPLEVNRLNKIWNSMNESPAVNAADYIVHSSKYSLDLMLKGHSSSVRSKTEVIPHAYSEQLYPARPKTRNSKIVMRYVGVLYGRRSPEPLFLAMNLLFKKRPELRERLVVELIGVVPPEMLQTEAAKSLPTATIQTTGSVSFVESLEKMYDADILLLIEANIRQNLFLPSKISDYFGANTPIVGIVPPGGSEDAMKELGAWHASPADTAGIAEALEKAINHVQDTPKKSWCNHDFRVSFSGDAIASRFSQIIARLR